MYIDIKVFADNDAFVDNIEGEIKRVVDSAITKLPDLIKEALDPRNRTEDASAILFDINGNSVGVVDVKEARS